MKDTGLGDSLVFFVEREKKDSARTEAMAPSLFKKKHL